MKNPRFEISREQTLQLAELRDILASTSSEDAVKAGEFPTAHYLVGPLSCIDCATSCSTTCVTGCVTWCKTACLGTCKQGCFGTNYW